MNSPLAQLVNGALIFAAGFMAIFLIARSKARTWRILGWFACILALTLLMVEAYGWHRRGDWQIKTAFDFWNEMQRSSLIWLNNQLPSAIWQVLDFLLHFPAWLVLGIGGILLLLLDHRQVQKQRIGAKPAPLLRRLKDWLFKPQEEEADQA